MATLTANNGQLTTAQLATAETNSINTGTHRLRTDAAAAYRRMLAAGMKPGCLRSAYRTLAEQKRMLDIYGYPRAAMPGRSQHGEGLAADVDEPARTWIRVYGTPYGWVSGLVAGEPWHFEYQPDRDKHTPTTASTGSLVLRRGSKGPRVGRLQAGLNSVFPMYSKLKEDQSYGPATAGVVGEFQRRTGLDADEVVGPDTIAMLARYGITL